MAYDWRKEEYEVTRPGRTRIDYRQEIGRAHVPIGVEREFSVLDPDRAEYPVVERDGVDDEL